jgi:UDPglucose 6-dehydrogenase
MNICVVGSGYVGLVTGACLADFGVQVTGVDKDAGKVEALERGEIPIYEPGLETLVATATWRPGRLSFTTDWGRRSRGPTPCSSPSARRRARTARPT